MIKKSTILGLSLQKFVKMVSPWVGEITRISAKLEQNCEFFIVTIQGGPELLVL